MNIKTIATRGGHSLDVGGASSIVSEVKEDRKITPYVNSGLIAGGYKVIDVTPTYSGTSAVDLTTAMNKAKNAGADLFVSIHLNAFDKVSHGVEVIYDNDTKDMANRIVAQLAGLGFYARGTYADRRGLYEFNASPSLPNLIVECFFVDNAGDVALYNKVGPAAIGHKIAEGIMGKSVVVASSPAITTASKIDSMTLYIQKTLNRLKIADTPLTEDGISGTKTKAAIIKFQDIVNITRDGVPGIVTQNAFNDILLKPVMSIGNYNRNATRYLQYRLGLIKDGIYGNTTAAWVKSYQVKNGLIADSICGKNTWGKLIS